MAKDIEETTPTPKVVETKEEMMTVFVDPKATDGGITINGVPYVGEVTVPKTLARSLMSIQQNYSQVKNKMHDPSQKILMQNGYAMERMFLADPAQNVGNPMFSQEYGLLDPWQFNQLPQAEQERLKQLKKALYSYNTNQF